MKKFLNSNGFSALEVTLVIIVMGIIGGSGYYVYNSQKETKKLLDSTASSTPQETSKKSATPNKEAVTAQYKNTSLGFSFSYPKDWTKESGQLYQGFKEDVSFKSPDLKLLTGNDYGEIEQGGSFSLQVYETQTTGIEEYAKNGLDGGPFDPYSKVKVDGVDAYRGKCGHPVADSECLVFVKSGGAYNLLYRHATSETNANAKYKTEFDKLVSSFKFE